MANPASAGCVGAALSACQNETNTLSGFFIPSSVIIWYQNERYILGIGPPSSTGIMLLVFGIPMIFAILVMKGKDLITGFFNFLYMGATFQLRTPLSQILFIISAAVIISLLVYIIYKRFFAPPPDTASTDAATAQAAVGTATGFQNMAPPDPNSQMQYKLINIQPVAVKQAGFLGPQEAGGSFDPSLTIMSAIRGGARFFTLQIDYLENKQDPKNFDSPNTPTLLYKNALGKLLSVNGGKISDVAKHLANYAFNPDIRDTKYPIILYLHFVRTPDPIRDPKGYLKFLMAVANDLQPIQQYMLNATSQGKFGRQQSEAILLQLDLTTIESTIIVLSNADTTFFRNAQSVGVQVDPTSDLDQMVNMRVWLDVEGDSFGVTAFPGHSIPNAVIVPYSRIKGMSQKERDAFAIKGKRRFVIAMPGQLESPTAADLKSLNADTGVNAIPLNLVGSDPAPINALLAVWGNKSYYQLKPMMLQSYKVAVQPNGAGLSSSLS